MSEILEYIKQNFVYNSNGTLTRLDRKNSNGSLDKDGYLILKIKGKKYRAHRVVYALINGRFPNGEIDHINRNRLDNRIENLREVTRKENIKNTTKKINKDTGVIGVYIDKLPQLKKKYAVKTKNKTFRFYTLQEAVNKRSEINGFI